MVEKGRPLKERSDTVWIADMVLLADKTKHLSVLNVSLQGKNAVVSTLYSYMKTIKTKLQLFKGHCLQTNPCTIRFLALQDVNIGSTWVEIVKYAAVPVSRAKYYTTAFRILPKLTRTCCYSLFFSACTLMKFQKNFS